MADSMFNFNTGDSGNSGLNNAQYKPASVDAQSAANVEYEHNWLRTPRPFGLNVRVPETPVVGENTEALIKKTAKDLLLAPVKEIVSFFEKYEKVFSGEAANELKSLYVQRLNTASLLQNEDEEVFGTTASKFMMDM